MPATVVHSYPIHRSDQAASLRASVWPLVIHASVGFRIAYQAILQSLVEKLEALDGGREPARYRHLRFAEIIKMNDSRVPDCRRSQYRHL